MESNPSSRIPLIGRVFSREPSKTQLVFICLMTLVLAGAGNKMVAARIGEALGDEGLRAQALDLVARAKDVIEKKCWVEEKGFYADSTTSQN